MKFNPAHLHLILNHIPIVANGLGLFVLLLGMIQKSSEVKKAALWIFVISALTVLPTYFSGDAAEKMVEKLPGVMASLVQEHEEAGLIALLGAEFLGLLALLALYLGKGAREVHKMLIAMVFILSLLLSGIFGYTANLGGQIHHEEIRAVPGRSQ